MAAPQTAAVRLTRKRLLDHSLPPLLRPVIRAYLLGYASSTAPRLLTLLLTHLGRKKKSIDDRTEDNFLPSLVRILKGGLELKRFPTFCAVLVGGSTLFEIPLRKLFARFESSLSQAARLRLTRWLSTFVAAWFSLKLLQSKKSEAFVEMAPYDTPTGVQLRPKEFAGRTMDLTLFAVTRALDVMIGQLWSQRKYRRTAVGKWNHTDKAISSLADSSIFSASCALIMWAWIYSPDRLPRSYNKWIKSAAAVDQRLVIALRRMRYGEIKYGVETGQAHVLQGVCKKYNLPLDLGDPVKSIPYSCEIVHMGAGPNCEVHAAFRLIRSFTFAFSTYLPLNLALTLRNPSLKGLIRALISSIRSSAFLSSFIGLFYYGICLARTRVGPYLIGTSTAQRQRIDSGICVGTGCAVCGWSILLENPGRRQDISMFVAPRALATLLPRRYLMEHQWRETLAFAMSSAVVFTCVAERPERVRGVLGKVLHGVLNRGK